MPELMAIFCLDGIFCGQGIIIETNEMGERNMKMRCGLVLFLLCVTPLWAQDVLQQQMVDERSEERRVGKECRL